MKVKTSDLTGPALDWAVAKAEGWRSATHGLLCRSNPMDDGALEHIDMAAYTPSTDWADGGPIIERECIRLDTNDHPDLWPWVANKVIRWEKREDEEMGDWPVYAEGGADTPLVAAMRCFVASRLGDEVDVPEELCK